MSNTRTNQEWLHDLNASGLLQEAAIADLRDLLLRAALYFFIRNLNDFAGSSRDEILQRAEDCAQDALIALAEQAETDAALARKLAASAPSPKPPASSLPVAQNHPVPSHDTHDVAPKSSGRAKPH